MAVPKFSLVKDLQEISGKGRRKPESTAVIIGTIKTEDGFILAPGTADIDAEYGGKLRNQLEALRASGALEEIIKLATPEEFPASLVVAVGLGAADAEEHIAPDSVRRASGAAARAIAGFDNALTTLSRVDLQASVEGLALGAYTFSKYLAKVSKKPVSTVHILAPEEGTGAAHRATVKAAANIAEAVSIARDLINTPPNDLYPASFAEYAEKLADEHDLKFEVLDEKALKRKGFGGIVGVGAGSSRPPRLLRITYRGNKPVRKIALVGKGITFDSGGISIKPAANMAQMTSDMSGAAAVLASVVLAAKLKYPLEVIAHIPLAENLPSGAAYRPGDVLTMYGGKTVEVLNTDAEGRLVLADALVRAAEDEPDFLIDVATLTGAQMVALGNRTAGIMGSDDFRDRVAEIAQATGEGGWTMPMPAELRSDLDSRLADIANSSGTRWGGMLVGAIFLKEFVPDEIPWVHLDIAGPSFNTGSAWGYTPKGGTGTPVRTLAAVLADIADKK